MKTLFFITSRFPYEPGEAFIETEFPYLYSVFDRVIIVSRNIKGTKMRPVPADVKIYRYNPASSFGGYLLMPALIISNIKKIIALVKDEINFRNETGQSISKVQRLYLLKTIIKSLQFRNFINEVIRKEKAEGMIVIYSYWMNIGARAMSLMDFPEGIRIARAHRIDLYEEATGQKYIPLLKTISKELDAVYFISENGMEYFERKTGISTAKNIIARLGINNPFPFLPGKMSKEVFRIVSCSTLIKVKRVHLIILALAKVQSPRKIIWNHFGDGNLKNELSDLASEKLGNMENIEFRFMGQVQNSEIMEFYNSNEVGLFINTSSSEGIPVSIMEAQSFGIPVIATDTGGVKEIITEKTGILLPPDFIPDDLACLIEYYINISAAEMSEIRSMVYDSWRKNYNASVNYEEFIRQLNSILAPGNNDPKKLS